MTLCTLLPDAPPVDDQDGDQWLFCDDSGHSDWVLCPEYLPAMHARYVVSRSYTVRRFPGMTAKELDDQRLQWLLDNDQRLHPSLSAAERNA